MKKISAFIMVICFLFSLTACGNSSQDTTDNPLSESSFPEEIVGNNPSSFVGEDLPVDSVSWLEAVSYCNLRSVAEGLTPAYQIDGETCVPHTGQPHRRISSVSMLESGLCWALFPMAVRFP